MSEFCTRNGGYAVGAVNRIRCGTKRGGERLKTGFCVKYRGKLALIEPRPVTSSATSNLRLTNGALAQGDCASWAVEFHELSGVAG